MTSLFMLAWMSILVAIIHNRTSGPLFLGYTFLASEVACLFAGMLEAGALESKAPTRGRLLSRLVAFTLSFAYLVAAFIVSSS